MKYSRLARNVIRRRTSSGTKNESATARWLLARIAPPRAGTCSSPSIVGRASRRISGPSSTYFDHQYSTGLLTPHVDATSLGTLFPPSQRALLIGCGIRRVVPGWDCTPPASPRRGRRRVKMAYRADEWRGRPGEPRTRRAQRAGPRRGRVRGDRRGVAPGGRGPGLAGRRPPTRRTTAHPPFAAPAVTPLPHRPYGPETERFEHFVPPEPPPLPRIGPPAAVGITLLVLGLTLVIAPGVVGVSNATGCRSACSRWPPGWAGWSCGSGPLPPTTATRTTTGRRSRL